MTLEKYVYFVWEILDNTGEFSKPELFKNHITVQDRGV